MNGKIYSTRQQVKDCWNAHLLQNASYSKKWELPLFPSTNAVPGDLQSFRYINHTTKNSKWIHFYAFDEYLEDIWENPELWAKQLKRFSGVISPDLSVCRDMPFPQQLYNTYRNRVLAHFFAQQGIPVIPNIRWADERTLEFAFEGIGRNTTVCVSTSGMLAHTSDRECFQRGFNAMVKALSPSTVLVYGSMPTDIFSKYQNDGIRFAQYDIDTQKAHKGSDQ